MSETVTDAAVVARESAVPSPIFRGASMVRALADYRELQAALDKAMPDQLMAIGDRSFRKKGYWRAIAVAFNLTVEAEREERSVLGTLDNGSDNYAYSVTYRATAPNGRAAVGDGTCAASEKQRGRMEATEHNVRSHAHTRAFNRAVSNLVGFGEVSAEEMERDEHGEASTVTPQRADGSALVKAVDTKTGTGKNNKPWTMYLVTFDDGRSGSTFDAKLAALAATAKESGELVVPTLEQAGKFTNLTGLAPAGGNGHEGDTLTQQDKAKLWAIAKEHGWTADEVTELIHKAGFEDSDHLPRSRAGEIANTLKERRKPEGGA